MSSPMPVDKDQPETQVVRCHRRPIRPFHPPGRAGAHQVGQGPGVCCEGGSGLDRSCRCKDRLHRAREPMGEWIHRELQCSTWGELLDGEIFYTLAEARIVIESWRRFYNTRRPHGSPGYRPPAPKVFIPQSARAAALPQPASPPALAPRPPMH